MVVDAPVALLLGDESTKVAIRAGVAGGPRRGQQSLGADAAAFKARDIFTFLKATDQYIRTVWVDEVGDLVVVVRGRRPGLRALGGLDDALDGLGGGRADLGGGVVGADLSVGGKYVHAFPN